MRNRIVSVIFAVGIIAVLAGAQDTMKKDAAAPKPAMGPSQVVLENWNDIGRKLIAMAEDFPEDKYDFKPAPTQRSFAEQLLHAAGANYYFTNSVMGLKPPTGDPTREQYKTKAAVVDYVKKAFADGAAAIKAKGDKGMSDLLVVGPSGNEQVRVSDLAWGFIEHSGEHYGQLAVYYRVSGLVPPESRPRK